MVHRIEIATRSGLRDARGEAVRLKARTFCRLNVDAIETRDIYLILAELSRKELEEIRQEFTDPITQISSLSKLDASNFHWHLLIGFRPGVTDNVGKSARSCIQDILGHPLDETIQVFTKTAYLIRGETLTREDALRLGQEWLANTLIQQIEVSSFEEWKERPCSLEVPLAGDDTPIQVKECSLSLPDETLLQWSKETGLGLNLEELRAIRSHFSDPQVATIRQEMGLTSNPTDVEMECIAQTWSEHCKHKIFNAQIDYQSGEGETLRIHSLFDTFIRKATHEMSQERPWLLSVFHDNAGVIAFDEDWILAYKVETHNSPSALDPYGGAITGIVGVNRDPFGTGKGAKLIANVWGYCLGSPFYEKTLPEGLLHPHTIRTGVHKGVIDGGNQSGIPYCRGWEIFDDRYLGKPLVYCGTLGLLPRTLRGQPAEKKQASPEDMILMVGGRIGKDGIHGATFSSEELHASSPAQAVQIGDPITQKKMTDFLLEARDLGLYTCITDNGAGGLSSSVGEMALDPGGCELDLAKAPLKYQGLQPWEIFLSEAQERMTVAVAPEHVDRFLDLARKREVEASILGRFVDSGLLHVTYEKRVVAHLSLHFLHEGLPTLKLKARWRKPREELIPEECLDASPVDLLCDLLGSLNLCSGEEKARQYDHEVKGLSVVKPFIGLKKDIPSDGTIITILPGKRDGVVLTEGVNPHLSDLDTYVMASWSVDLAVRRYVASGGNLSLVAGLDNFCWPDPIQSEKTPDGEYKLAQLVRACQGLYDAVKAFGVPLISGKDSMKNDSTRGGVKISIPPTLLVSVIGKIEDVDLATTLEPKHPGDWVYVLGRTSPALGGSEVARVLGDLHRQRPFLGTTPSDADLDVSVKACKAVHRAIREGLLDAAHAPGKGGLAVGWSKMCFAGEIGMDLDLALAPGCLDLPLITALFSETAGRFILVVSPDNASSLDHILDGIPYAKVGQITKEPRLCLRFGPRGEILRGDLFELKKRWKATLQGV